MAALMYALLLIGYGLSVRALVRQLRYKPRRERALQLRSDGAGRRERSLAAAPPTSSGRQLQSLHLNARVVETRPAADSAEMVRRE